jgi:hypothetical protein
MTPEVEVAVEEVRQTFPNHRIEVTPEAQGGAYVVVYEIELGDCYTPTTTWVGFLIPFPYPHADVYPHFIDPGVRRVDGKPLGPGFSAPMSWHNQSAVQVSRRSK